MPLFSLMQRHWVMNLVCPVSMTLMIGETQLDD